MSKIPFCLQDFLYSTNFHGVLPWLLPLHRPQPVLLFKLLYYSGLALTVWYKLETKNPLIINTWILKHFLWKTHRSWNDIIVSSNFSLKNIYFFSILLDGFPIQQKRSWFSKPYHNLWCKFHSNTFLAPICHMRMHRIFVKVLFYL